jgi:hypothetical protein
MDGQRAKLAARRFDRVGTIPPTEPSPPSPPPQPEPSVASAAPPPTLTRLGRPAPTPPRLMAEAPDGISALWAAVMGVGWPLAIIAWLAVMPAPADPDAAVPVLVDLATLGLELALVTTAIAAGVRHRGAAVGGLVTGLLAMTFTVTCPVSGHHTLGLWWFGQLAIVTVMLALSAIAFQRTHRPAASDLG